MSDTVGKKASLTKPLCTLIYTVQSKGKLSKYASRALYNDAQALFVQTASKTSQWS